MSKVKFILRIEEKLYLRNYNSFNIDTNNKSIISINSSYSLGSTTFYQKINNYIRDNTILSNYHRFVLIGILLGDGRIRKINLPNNNARIIFKQSIINFPYVSFVFILLYPYCFSYPRLENTIINFKKCYLVVFGTINYPCFNELYEMFMDKGNKHVPGNIFEELTPVALAHWIMCDGTSTGWGLLLCTDSFTIKEVVLLINVLLIEYNIITTLHKCNNLPRIYIGKKEVIKLRIIIEEYIIPFFSV